MRGGIFWIYIWFDGAYRKYIFMYASEFSFWLIVSPLP